MFPCFWIWAPTLHFPWSGAVAQNIEPRTAFFEQLVPAGAGQARIEAEVTEQVSYGRQLGVLTEAVLDLASRLETKDAGAGAGDAVRRLREIDGQIQAIKDGVQGPSADRIVRDLQALRRRGGPSYEAALLALQAMLAADPAA